MLRITFPWKHFYLSKLGLNPHHALHERFYPLVCRHYTALCVILNIRLEEAQHLYNRSVQSKVSIGNMSAELNHSLVHWYVIKTYIQLSSLLVSLIWFQFIFYCNCSWSENNKLTNISQWNIERKKKQTGKWRLVMVYLFNKDWVI